jgi:UDP-N-acetylmuramate dehydrogenase
MNLSQNTRHLKLVGPRIFFYEVDDAFDSDAHGHRLAANWIYPILILGGGSNVLAGDKGFRGVVVANRKGRIIQLDEKRLEIESGVKNLATVDFLAQNGLAGLEFLVGIPGTMGGAIQTNAHFRSIEGFGQGVFDFKRAKNCFVHDLVEAVLIVNAHNTVSWVDKAYIRPQYHKTELKSSDDIILSARFKLQPESPETIRKSIKAFLKWRKDRSTLHPKDPAKSHMPPDALTGHTPRQPAWPSAGCTFSNTPNPDNHPAGRMLDMCGLKGTRIGNVMVACEHANFIVNLGGGKAKDVLALIALCRAKVKERFQVDLETEVDLIGEF